MMSPKDTKLILEILELPHARVVRDIDCNKGDFSAFINGHRRNRTLERKFADYVSQKLREKILSEPSAAT